MEFGFRARLGSNVTPRLATRTPGVGSAIGRGLQQAGSVAARVSYRDGQVNERVRESDHQVALLEQRRAREVAIADAAVRKAAWDMETSELLEEARKDAPVGATGHTEAARTLIDERADEFLRSLPDDPEIRNRFKPTIASASARAVIGEQAWEAKTRARFIGESYSQWLDTRASGLFSKPDDVTAREMIAEGDGVIAALDNDETTKAILRRDLRDRTVGALLGGLMDGGRQDTVRKLIESGQFDAILSDDDKKDWSRLIGAADRSDAARIKAAQNEQQRLALDAAKDIELRIERGDGAIPSAGEIQGVMQAMEAANVPQHERREFAYMAEDAITAKGLAEMPTRQLERERAALSAKVNAGTSTAAERRTIGLIEGQLKTRDDKMEANFGAAWRSKDIAERSAALDAAAALPEAERLRAGAKIGGGFQLLTGVAKPGRDAALRGAAIREGRPKDDFLPAATARDSNPRDVLDRMAGAMMGELKNDIGAHYDDVVETALDIMAAYRSANGREAGWHSGDFEKAVQMLFGQTRRGDGVLQGGIGKVGRFTVELPAWSTAPEFEASLRAIDWSGAQYANGEAAEKRDILTHYRPRFSGMDGDAAVYVFQGPDGLLVDANFEPYSKRLVRKRQGGN